MDETAEKTRRAGCRPLALAAVFLAVSAAWWVVMQVLTALALIASMSLGGVSFKDMTTAISAHPSADVVAVASIIQLFGFLAIAAFLAGWVGPSRRTTFALRPVGWAFFALAAVGGATVGFFPGWLAQVLSKLLPYLDLGDLTLINQLLVQGSWHGRLLMLFAVVAVAPVVEESVFRGFLWGTLERALPPWATWLATSTIFALYHVDPIHVMAVFFTGLFLGWLRWTSGSVIPGMVAHFVNNGLAAILVLSLPSQPDATNPWWAAVLSVALTLLVGVVLWQLKRPPAAAPEGA